MKLLWVLVGFMEFMLCRQTNGFADWNVTQDQDLNYSEINVFGYANAVSSTSLMVGLTLIDGAAAKGAVCLDGSLPGYHIHRGYGSGANSWLIDLEGGGWCDTIRSCVYRKKSRHGSSAYMEKQIPFAGILSNKASENPDFFNWNRVKVRYCDGASFAGDGENKAAQLQFRGQRIYEAAMEDLMSKGMHYANQALLTGCSAGAVATVLHCDEFREMFPRTTRVKCLGDAGLFLDALDVSGSRTLRNMFRRVVNLQGVKKNLPRSCTNHVNPNLCFFPQHLIASVKTPLFLVNAAYDTWQIQASLAPPTADRNGHWNECKKNHVHCSTQQINFFQKFRNQMLKAVSGFSRANKNGFFINSCFAHCQTETQDTWFSQDSPHIGNKGIAKSVGNWYFDRANTKAIDCPYPCDKTCHNIVFK